MQFGKKYNYVIKRVDAYFSPYNNYYGFLYINNQVSVGGLMREMDTFTFRIDGKELTAFPSQSILEAALEAGIFIPHLCHHKDLPDIGGCGLCVVETNGETVRACLTEAQPGMEVVSKSESLDHIRTVAIQLMLAGHIDDCNSCPKYLKCEFQMLIQNQGATVGDLRGTARGLSADTGNPLIIRDMERCIACGRCVRVCNSVRKVGALTYADDSKGRKQVVTKGENLRESDCRFCGACVEVCPTGALRDKEGVFAEAFCKGDMLVPCSYECPAHLDIPEYIRFIRRGDDLHALEKILERAPFPRSLGNICMKFCENKCRRQYIDESVSICSLKRYAALSGIEQLKDELKPAELNGKKIAIIGAGPSGLTSAWLLRMKGYEITLFEKMPEPGGMMRYGLPEYRLSTEDLKADVDTILSLGGINLICGKEIADRAGLDMFDAVIWCGGAQAGATLPIEGADAAGVLTGLDFLKSIRLGNKPEIGSKVVVLGGGDVAYDCARSAIRLGADASVCCIEPEDRMTCTEHESVDGAEEGVHVLAGRTFERIVTENGRVTGLECKTVSSFEFDKTGILTVEKDESSAHVVECDTVIFAIGQKVVIPAGMGLKTDSRGRASSARQGNIICAGDAVTGTSSVVQAVAWGQKAASEIDSLLGGDGKVIPKIAPKQEKDTAIADNCFFNELRKQGCFIEAQERKLNFKPYVSPLECDEAVLQSSRCLQCDLRKEISRPRLYSEFAFKREVQK